MAELLTIFGGSGFVGRYITRRMAQAGWRVRVAVRRPNEALFVKPYGAVGQVEPVFCNIRDDASVATVLSEATAVVNCVGILNETGKNTFDAVQTDGAERIARLAAAAGIKRMVQLSAIGADASSRSIYAQTKASGEAAVLRHQPQAIILRPSIVFGPEDQFFNRFAQMARSGPVVPVVGASTKFQPVYVDDVAQAAERYLLGKAPGGTYELGGPEVMSFRDLMAMMLTVIRRRRFVASVPMPVGWMMGASFDILQRFSFGLIENKMITRDQVANLAVDNVVSPEAKGFEALDITPTAMAAILPDYLWRFRPEGQYATQIDSAENLKP